MDTIAKAELNPLTLWHLLSLDAPTTAALWTWFIAAACHIALPLPSTLSMFLAVWMLYAADRLLDARLLDARLLDARTTSPHDLEARHYFHHRHSHAFLIGIFLAALALADILPHLDPHAIRLYLLLGALVFAYFTLIHAVSSAHRLPKEIAVGIFFAAATFIPTVARRPELRLPLLPSALALAALCSLNCLFLYAWEHPHPTQHSNSSPHAITRLALSHLHTLAAFTLLASAALAAFDRQAPRTLPLAITLATLLLLLLDHRRHRISALTLRAAADLTLATPILLIPFL